MEFTDTCLSLVNLFIEKRNTKLISQLPPSKKTHQFSEKNAIISDHSAPGGRPGGGEAVKLVARMILNRLVGGTFRQQWGVNRRPTAKQQGVFKSGWPMKRTPSLPAAIYV